MTKSTPWILIPACMIAACRPALLTAEQAKVKADEFVAQVDGIDNPQNFDIWFRDAGDSWLVLYSPRGEVAGRTVGVKVDKGTGKAVAYQPW